jgi:hypothetical protein
MTLRGLGRDSLALGRTTAQTSEVGFGPRFIQKNQLGRIEARLPPAPETAGSGDVGAVLLAGAECLFLYVNPILPKTTWIAWKEHCKPKASRSPIKGRSFFLANNERIWLRWAARIIGLRPA